MDYAKTLNDLRARKAQLLKDAEALMNEGKYDEVTAKHDEAEKISNQISVVERQAALSAEAAELEALWIKLGNCIGATKQLQPIGVYVPSENKTVVFHIEGLSEQEKKQIPEIRAPYDTDVYCVTCNKTQHVKAGEVLPFCCGRLMEILD